MKKEAGTEAVKAIRRVLEGSVYLSNRELEEFEHIERASTTCDTAEQLALSGRRATRIRGA